MQWNLLLLLYLYILEGVPYGLQSRFLPLILRSHGLSLTALGVYKLLYIPWLLKCLYAPFVDALATKRAWLLGSLLGLFSVTVVLSAYHNIIPYVSSEKEPARSLPMWPLAFCLFMYNLFAATQDIAVDGIALLFLTSSQLAVGNTIQVVGYKLGAIVGGGLLTSLTSVFDVSQVFGMIACIYAIGIILCMWCSILEDGGVENESKGRICLNEDQNDCADELHLVSHWDTLRSALFDSAGSRNLIVLLLVYKLGEQGAMNMLPLMLFDRGASVAKLGMWSGIVGQICSIAGSTAGYQFQNMGWSTLCVLSRLMILRAVLQLPLLVIAADPIGSASPNGSFVLGMACMNLTLFVSGAITTVMFTLMMQCTRSESSSKTHATHYTILSTAELLGKLIFGIIASPFTDLVGYTMSNLAFLLVSLLPIWFVQTRHLVLSFVPTFRTKQY
ncbi:MFS transporter PAT family beta-lactamase induction signal transducer ampG [Paragonimus heterotremus]|uniref:MFS transporter PAT family beta-lactamase induction signal transducer ampG n=1 Tax=Paragonimus heterotremus TaxID=100268 RepID=A0A8J4WHN8_9TREM|nr:MFS transporter PAT family beta-lactamase induction signal transducer ampG [Paragonimus heterotremus]